MRHSQKTRILSLLLAVLMVLGMSPMTAFAAEEDQTVSETAESETSEAPEAKQEETVVNQEEEDAGVMLAGTSDSAYDTSVSGEYFNVLSEKEYNLAPGATETEIILNNDSGTDRKVVHVFTVDTKNENIQVLPGYYGIDKLDPDDLTSDEARKNWKTAGVSVTAQYYQDTLGYNVVGAMNTSLAYDSDAPYDFMVYNGVVLSDNSNHTSNAQTYLVIYKDGTCELRSRSTPLDGSEWQAISANFGWIVRDGALTNTTVERDDSDASRSMIGIKADGTLVFCLVDGRNSPTSTGLSSYELGEMMLALGCVNAVNCDGGGSSSFVSKREGETGLTMRSVPSDGAERPTINSVVIVSNAKATGEFDHANLACAYDYVAPGATVTVTADGIDGGGYPVDVPADAAWQLSDETMGTVENGVFTAGSTEGQVTVQLVYNDEIVGEMELNIVHPVSFGFDTDSTVIPYGKSAALGIEAAYGADNWNVCVEGAYELTLDDENAGTLQGNTLTATSDESVTGVNVTVTYLADPTLTDTIAVTFGKGSEILFSFEDGDISEFLGVDEMIAWAEQTGASAPITGNGNFSSDADSETFLATADNGGQVKHGDYALGVTLDYTDAQFASWCYNMFFYTGEATVLRDTANGQNATAFGAWVYIPEGAAGVAMQLGVYSKYASGETYFTQLNFQVMTQSGEYKNMNAITEADIPESRWVYCRADLTAKDYYSLVDPMGELSREPSFMRYYVKPTLPAKLTFYFDDFTLDYSSAVDDRVLPTISGPSYATADESVTLNNGAVISGNSIAFSANVSDNTGLDASTGRILVDGVEVDSTVSGSVLSCGNVMLTSGVHTVTFEIQDKLGNLGKLTRTFTVSGDAVVTLTGHNDSGELAEYDSVYYADLVAADIARIQSVTATLKLQTANTWEPEGISIAEGFKASYEYDELNNELTVTVTRIAAGSLTEEQTLVSLPIRVWSWDGINHVTGEEITPEAQFKTGYCPIVTIDFEVVCGVVEFTESSDCLGTFGGEYSVETNLNDNVNPWHYHDSELTVLSKDATCLCDGYTGRTYCETCKSVIDWGTTVSSGHTYEIVDNQLVCACGDVVTGNGIVTANGKLYCLIADKLVTGWQAVDGGWCYVDSYSHVVYTGEFTVSGLTYTADENGIVIKGAWVTDENGTRYSYGPAFYKREWAEIDGATYYFDEDTYMFTGIRYIPVNRNNLKEGLIWYEFAEDGKYIGKVNGFVTYNDLKYYVVDGEFNYGGLMLIDGDYYYARTSGQLVCGRDYWITKTNDLLPAAKYSFDADGKMIDPPTTDEGGDDSGETTDPTEPSDPTEPEVKNGIVEEDGKKYWYVDGVKTYGGLMLIDGDYYYARTSGEIVCGRDYWITKTNDLLPAAKYSFDADGKMIDPPTTDEGGDDSGETTDPTEPSDPTEPEVKNGIVEEDGKKYWYVDGVKTYGGLMLIDGDYYYARTSGEIVCGKEYWITKTNDLLPAAWYTFDEDGKMVDPPVTE